MMMRNILLTLMMVCFFPTVHFSQTPDVNYAIYTYVKSQIGKQVGRGECWDLAAEALNRNKCKWDGQYVYGKLINPRKDTVYPGDIIQFYDVKVQYNRNDSVFKESFAMHTAVIYEVTKQGEYIMAHQNYNRIKTVVLTKLTLASLRSGYIKFYRPVEKN